MKNSATGSATLPRPKSRSSTLADATTTARTDACTRPCSVRRQNSVRHRIADVRHVISQLHLRRNNNRRFNRQLGMLIPHNNRRRRNLLHRQSRQPALGRLQHVAISPTAPTAHLSLRWLQQRKVPGIHQRNHLGRRLYGSNHAPPNQRASNDDPDDQNVDTRRTQRPTPLVVVEAPDITHRLWLGLQLKRWKFFRKKDLYSGSSNNS